MYNTYLDIELRVLHNQHPWIEITDELLKQRNSIPSDSKLAQSINKLRQEFSLAELMDQIQKVCFMEGWEACANRVDDEEGEELEYN